MVAQAHTYRPFSYPSSSGSSADCIASSIYKFKFFIQNTQMFPNSVVFVILFDLWSISDEKTLDLYTNFTS